LRDEKAFPDRVSPEEFAQLLAQLVSGGFILIPGFEPTSAQSALPAS
jgi:hypothetical protein